METKISVIVPVYNTEKYLVKCIDSIINQTFRDIEIICVDDCSTDNSLNILKKYEAEDSRVKVIHLNKNKSQGGARNAGLNIAQGKYIAFIDSDDYIEENYLEKMYDKAEKFCCDLIVTNVVNIVEEQENSKQLELKKTLDLGYEKYERCTGFYNFDFYEGHLRIGCVAKLFRKSVIEEYKMRFPENIIHEDDAFYWFYTPFVKNLYYINEPLYFRLINNTSTMYHFINTEKSFNDEIIVIKQIKKFLKKYRLYKLYKNKFIDYIKGFINKIEDSDLKKCYYKKIALFAPEIIYMPKTEFILMKQIFFNRNKKIVFWGASLFLENFLQMFNIKTKNIIGIVDKDANKQGKNICSYQIFPPEKLAELKPDYVIFTIKNNSDRLYPIIKQYLDEKFPDIKLLPTIFSNKVCKRRPKNIPHRHLVRISVDIVAHCNLNCRSCNHFSPVAEEKYMDINEYERDIKRLSELCPNLKQCHLMGGEPLLHPQIIEFMRISRKYLPNTAIIIVTNGILLLSQKEEFWQACKKYNVVVEVTKYPINLNFEEIEKTAEKYDVGFSYFANSATVVKTSDFYPLDLKGRQDKSFSFANCLPANFCIALKNGYLYTCTIAPHIENFNKYFGCNLPLTEKDGINLYKAHSEKEIMKFLARPIPFCRFCDIKHQIIGVQPWGISKREVKEWT